DLPRRPAAASLPGARDLYPGPGTGADLRPVRRHRGHCDPAVAGPVSAGALFLQRLGGDAGGAGGFLRPALQHPVHPTGAAGPGELPGHAMKTFVRSAGAAAGMIAGGAVAMAQPAADIRNFVACPIVRDTSTVPCWLSEYDGELYYLGIQTDVSAPVHPPLLGHKVIVEGVVKEGPRICGGVVLEPVQLSPVAERDANCNQVWPAEDRYTIDFNPRPPGPSEGRLAFQTPVPPPPPEPAPRDFAIFYYFDGLIAGRNSGTLNQIVDYAVAIDASRVSIVAYQGDVLLSNGTTLTER